LVELLGHYKARNLRRDNPRTSAEFIALLRSELVVPDEEGVTLSSDLVHDLALDSLSRFLLVVVVEDLANETVPAPLLAQWRTLDDAYVWLTRMLQ
jgi:acyl carrier protein